MAQKPINESEFLEEVRKWTVSRRNGSNDLTISVESLRGQLKDQGLKFNSEEFCNAINSFLFRGLARLDVLRVSEYDPHILTVNIVFPFFEKKDPNQYK